VGWVGISPAGYVVTYSPHLCLLCSFTINGTPLASQETGEQLHALIFSEDGLVLLSGGENAVVVLRWVRSLELADDGPRAGLEAVLDGSLISNPAQASLSLSSAMAMGGGVSADYSASSSTFSGPPSFRGSGGPFSNLTMPGGHKAEGGTAAGNVLPGEGPLGAGGTLQVPPFSCAIRSLLLTASERHLVVGDEEGNVRVLVQDSDYLRDRLQRKLIEIGILD
jgi:hypothetical protein